MRLRVPEEVKAWVPWVGRRVDDVALRERLRTEGVTRLPRALEHEIPVSVTRPKQQLGFGFSPFVAHARYPPVASRGGFVPYLSSVQFGRDVWPGEVPRAGPLAAVKKALGAPDVTTPWMQEWLVPLDAARAVGLRFQRDDLGSMFWSLGVLGGVYLWVPSFELQRPAVALTASWLLRHGLLESAPLAAHRALVDAVTRREVNPGALLDAYPHGWWKEHVKDRPGLRHQVWSWLNGDSTEPLRELLGAVTDVESPSFGQVAIGDGWDAYDVARPALDAYFKKWHRRGVK